MVSYLLNYPMDYLQLVLEHLYLSGGALVVAFLISMPIGYWISKNEKWAFLVMGIWGLIYVIPSLALFSFFIPIFGLGASSVVFALILYGQVSLTRSIKDAFRQVEHEYILMGVALGLSRSQIYWKIKLPIATPGILGGLRVTFLNILSIATVGAWMNAGGLGVLIFDGLVQNNIQKILLGTLSIILISFIIGGLFTLAEKKLVGRN